MAFQVFLSNGVSLRLIVINGMLLAVLKDPAQHEDTGILSISKLG
jgi:hypothetical protein